MKVTRIIIVTLIWSLFGVSKKGDRFILAVNIDPSPTMRGMLFVVTYFTASMSWISCLSISFTISFSSLPLAVAWRCR